MTTQEKKDLDQLEKSLFFNKDRILRWMCKIQGENELHPELATYEEE